MTFPDTQQILQDLARVDSAQPIPVHSFNDDDWYVFESDSKMLVETYGHRFPRELIKVPAGCEVKRGMSAKYLGIWRYVG